MPGRAKSEAPGIAPASRTKPVSRTRMVSPETQHPRIRSYGGGCEAKTPPWPRTVPASRFSTAGGGRRAGSLLDRLMIMSAIPRAPASGRRPRRDHGGGADANLLSHRRLLRRHPALRLDAVGAVELGGEEILQLPRFVAGRTEIERIPEFRPVTFLLNLLPGGSDWNRFDYCRIARCSAASAPGRERARPRLIPAICPPASSLSSARFPPRTRGRARAPAHARRRRASGRPIASARRSREQVAAHRGQSIVPRISPSDDGVSRHHPRFDQLGEPIAEDVLRDPQPLLEIAEPACAGKTLRERPARSTIRRRSRAIAPRNRAGRGIRASHFASFAHLVS